VQVYMHNQNYSNLAEDLLETQNWYVATQPSWELNGCIRACNERNKLHKRKHNFKVFTARCTLVQSAVLQSHAICLSVCLSVCPSVTLVDCDHIGWNSSELISPLVSLGCSLSADPNIRGLLHGQHPEILAQNDPPPVDFSVGDIRSQIAAEWLQIA